MITKKHVATLANPDIGRVDGIGKCADVHRDQSTGSLRLRRERQDDAGGRMHDRSYGHWRNQCSRSAAGSSTTVPIPNADESPNASKETALVFHRYGDQYFLAGIKREGRIGYQLPAGKLEGELQARNVAEEVFTLLASAK